MKEIEDVAKGMGIVKGAPCQADTPVDLTDQSGNVIGKRLPLLWEDNEGETHTGNMDIEYSDIANMVLASLPMANTEEF